MMTLRFFFLLFSFLPLAASALNPLTPIGEYHHQTWTARDGAPTDVHAMAQTSDGWLWMSAISGLYRFDGVRFERYTLPRSSALNRRRYSTIRAHPDGSLWIAHAFGGGLSVLRPDGTLEDIDVGKQTAPIMDIIFGDDGVAWMMSNQGLLRLRGGKLELVSPRYGLPRELETFRIDRFGRFWVLATNALYLYDSAADKFNFVRAVPGLSSLAESPDGRIWTIDHKEARAVPLPSPPPTALNPNAPPRSPAFGNGLFGHIDHDGNLWQLRCPVSACVTTAADVARADRIATPLATASTPVPLSRYGAPILEDREHNIWIATHDGLERYRDNRLRRAGIPEDQGVFSMVVDEHGELWASNPLNTTAWRLRADAPPQQDPERAWLVAKDRTGALVLARQDLLERRYHGSMEKIPLPEVPGPDGKPLSLATLGVTDDGKRLWLVVTHLGLLGRVDGPWLPRSKFNLPPNIIMGIPGKQAGELWLACGDGSAALLDPNDKLTLYPAAKVGLTTGIFVNDEVIFAGDQGMSVFDGKGFRSLTADDAEALQNVSGLAVSPDGDRWLNGGKGLLHVRRDDWRASIANPSLPLRYELFGLQDGYSGRASLENRLPSARIDKDGQLWLSSTGGMLRLDTRHIARNQSAPVVSIAALRSGDSSVAIQPGLKLAAGTQNVSISYTAPSLRQPESVRFQYRLDGVDDEWQDAGSRRAAFYTNMGPGAYRFQVRAANEDGVWSVQPAALAFEIPPTVTQTLWFKAACVLAVAVALYLLYLYRLRIVTARLEERMEVRLAERERIARTLHDTVLQSVQGVVLRLDAAVEALPGDSAVRESLTPVLHSARASVSEGRAQVHELRSAEVDEVESRLRDLAPLLAASYPGVQFSLHIDGIDDGQRALRAGVVEEISEIACEALRNAYQHAQATHIEVRLGYDARQFTLQVRDDGIGMPPVADAGAPQDRGHWGLVGMRERAARIGAALEINSTQEKGCGVTMSLPARRAYANSHAPWWRRLFGS